MSQIHCSAKDLFFRAVQLPSADEINALLDEACGDDEQLRAQVEELLLTHHQAGRFLGDFSAGADTTADEPAEQLTGQTIGPYKLLEVIGEGGMGSVYMAEQTEPVHRRVALKLIKTGMDTRQVIICIRREADPPREDASDITMMIACRSMSLQGCRRPDSFAAPRLGEYLRYRLVCGLAPAAICSGRSTAPCASADNLKSRSDDSR